MADRKMDSVALVELSGAMMQKLDKTRDRQPIHWDDPDCTAELLGKELWKHVFKGDPIDVANFCMMLHARGEKIIPFAEAFNIPDHKA